MTCTALLWANNAAPVFVREGRWQCVHETRNTTLSSSCSSWCNRKHQRALLFSANLKELPDNMLSWWNWWLTRWTKVHFGDLPIVCHSLMLSSPWLLWASWGASCSPYVGQQLCCVCERRHSCEWWTRNRWRTCPSASRRYWGWHVIWRLSEASRHFCLMWLWAPKAMPSRPQITHSLKKTPERVINF